MIHVLSSSRRAHGAAICLAWCLASGLPLHGQNSSSREYIHLGGRVIAIENNSLTINTASLPPTGTANSSYTGTLSASGGTGQYNWSWSGNPPGLSINSITGAITGTIANNANGPYYTTITVTDSGPPPLTASTTFTITVSSTVAITVTSAPTGLSLTVDGTACPTPCLFQWVPNSSHTLAAAATQTGGANTRYNFSNWSPDIGGASGTITASSSVLTYTANYTTQYLLTTSVNPSNAGTITLNPATGDGWYNSGTAVTVTATNSAGWTFNSFSGSTSGGNPLNVPMTGPQNVTANFGQSGGGGPITITSNILPAANSPGTYSVQLQATGGSGSYTWTFDGMGALPSGLAISSAGLVSGSIPAGQGGYYMFGVTATDINNSQLFGSTEVHLRVVTPLTVPYSFLGSFALGDSNYALQLQPIGGTPPFVLTASGLPSWFTLSSTGLLSIPAGKVAGPVGSFSFTVTVVDSGSPQQVQTITLTGTVTPGQICLKLPTGAFPALVVPTTGPSPSVTLTTDNCQGAPVTPDWTLAGHGTLSPLTNSSSSTYSAPDAVFPVDVASISVDSQQLQASGSMQINLLTGPLTVTPVNTTVTTGQPVNFSVIAKLGDHWTSPDDYVFLDIDPRPGYQYSSDATRERRKLIRPMFSFSMPTSNCPTHR